jgi:hypothetical protein
MPGRQDAKAQRKVDREVLPCTQLAPILQRPCNPIAALLLRIKTTFLPCPLACQLRHLTQPPSPRSAAEREMKYWLERFHICLRINIREEA